MQRALITGGAGFIGSHLARNLLKQGHTVRLVDAFTPYYDPETKRARIRQMVARHPNAEFIEGDLLAIDVDSLLRGVDVVFHLAAQPGVRKSWGTGFGEYVSNNVLATQRLLEATKRADLSRFVYSSSSSIYGDAERHPTPEDTPPSPVSPYGVTKLAAEHLVQAYHRNFGLPSVSLRYFTVYGPGQRPDMAFYKFVRAIQNSEVLTVFDDGEQSRDVTYVADAVTATITAATAGDVLGKVINVGGGSVVTVNHCLRVLEKIAGGAIQVEYAPHQAGDARHTSADLRAASSLLSYTPTVSLEDGLRAEWEWLEGLGSTN